METAYAYQYSFLSSLFVALLIYFYSKVPDYFENKNTAEKYQMTIVCGILCGVMDIFFAYTQYGVLQLTVPALYLCEMVYLSAGILGAYYWFLFSEECQSMWATHVEFSRTLMAIPAVVMILCVVTTPAHELVFTIQDGIIVEGPLLKPFTVISVVLVLISGITALLRSFSKSAYANREKLRMLFWYALIISVSWVLQVQYWTMIPFRLIGVAIPAFIIHENGMQMSISLDALTQINNRYSLEKYLDGKFQSGRNFFLAMLDVDDFKYINDRFGHVEGDRALRVIADALKTAAQPGDFVARYGGDEFSIVTEEPEEKMTRFLEKAEEALAKVNEVCPSGYQLGISHGYAHKTENILTIPDILEEADQELYRQKNRKKEANSRGMSTTPM